MNNTMRIVTVIPIAKGISKDTLTYFTSADVSVGAIVSIPLRKKTAYGLVTANIDASEMKSELKSLAYSIRKVEKIETRGFLSTSFIKSAEKIADYNATSVGAVLSVLIPSSILEASKDLTYIPKEEPREKLGGVFYETTLLQSDDAERYATYRALVREEFAKSHSIFFCLPGAEDILNAKATLEKGIENYTHILHSGLSKKEIVKIWQKITTETHPVLIIATGSFLSLPRGDISTIILEKESSRGFKMQSRPFLDIRMVAEIIAKESGIRLVLGDKLLRVETLWKEKNPIQNSGYRELSPMKFRSLSTGSFEIDNIKAPADMKKKEFVVIGEKLKKLISHSVENNEHTFLFCGRKGLYPMTVCSDCGTIVVCKNCNAPVVLYGKQNGKTNLFVCHHCGERRDAHELCRHCGGWRLLPLGIGTERVFEELKRLLPKTLITIMDKDHVATHKQAVKTRDAFYNNPGSIMIGTEIAIPYLNQKIENVGVISIDSFFSIPDFQIHEKIFHILLTLRDISQKNMIVQTRKEETRLFDYALHGNLVDFYRDEIEERKAIGYPPFVTYIKLTLEGEKLAIKEQMERAGEALQPFELSVFDAFNPGSKSQHVIHGLISLPKGGWVNKELLEKLRSLPPSFSIKIDPDTLL